MWTWSQRPVNLTCRASSIPNATIYWWSSHYETDIEENDPRIYINSDGESTLLVFLNILFINTCLFKNFTLEFTVLIFFFTLTNRREQIILCEFYDSFQINCVLESSERA